MFVDVCSVSLHMHFYHFSDEYYYVVLFCISEMYSLVLEISWKVTQPRIGSKQNRPNINLASMCKYLECLYDCIHLYTMSGQNHEKKRFYLVTRNLKDMEGKTRFSPFVFLRNYDRESEVLKTSLKRLQPAIVPNSHHFAGFCCHMFGSTSCHWRRLLKQVPWPELVVETLEFGDHIVYKFRGFISTVSPKCFDIFDIRPIRNHLLQHLTHRELLA